MQRRWCSVFLAAGALVCAAGPDFIPRHTRPRCLKGIPQADYVQGPSSRELALSTDGVLLERVAPPSADGAAAPLKMRYFQLDQAAVKVEHCSLSQVAFAFEPDGRWRLNCRADQNPVAPPSGLAPTNFSGPKTTLGTEHLRRNEFHVRVRCYGAFPVKESAGLTGKPVFVELTMPPFWVQRGEPQMKLWQNQHPDLARFFDLIDRVQIDFFFR